MSEELLIEKGIPLPKSQANSRRQSIKRTFEAMQLTESVVLPAGDWGNVFSIAKQAGIKITTQRLGDAQVRVWRIE